MNTAIIVKFQVEALHAWPGVVDNEDLAKRVGFLQFPHRHIFHFKAIKKVSHADRDIEIIDLKRIMTHYLLDKYGRSPHGTTVPHTYKSHCDFGSQSCEMLGQELVNKFQLHSCEVLEDNENGAVVFDDKILKVEGDPYISVKEEVEIEESETQRFVLPGITFICGALCSGKSYIGSALSEKGALQVEVSNIVKSLKKLSPHHANRGELQGSPELDKQIIEAIVDLHETHSKKYPSTLFEMIVTGVRQKSILEAFPGSTCIWIDADVRLRHSRFLQSAKDKGTSMKDADTRDEALGLLDVKKYIFTRNTI